jgi:hypothetical protein
MKLIFELVVWENISKSFIDDVSTSGFPSLIVTVSVRVSSMEIRVLSTEAVACTSSADTCSAKNAIRVIRVERIRRTLKNLILLFMGLSDIYYQSFSMLRLSYAGIIALPGTS